MRPPIGVHLYSVRREARDDFERVLRSVAEIGFLGVEVEGLHGMAPATFRALADELELEVVSVSIEDDGALATAQLALEVGAGAVIDGFYDLGPDDVRRQVEELNAAVAAWGPRGMAFGYHNHEREFTHAVDGRRAWDVVVEQLDPRVFLEVDYVNAALADVEPVELLRLVGERARLLHVKDESSPWEPAPVGSGRFDTPAILAAAGAAEWHIVEYEACENALDGVEESYRFLVERGLSRGRR